MLPALSCLNLILLTDILHSGFLGSVMKSKLWQHLETDITETRETLAVPTGDCSAQSFNTTKWQPIFYLGNVYLGILYFNSDAWSVLFLHQATARFKTRQDGWDYMIGLSIWYKLLLSLCSQRGNTGNFMECECGSWSARESGAGWKGEAARHQQQGWHHTECVIHTKHSLAPEVYPQEDLSLTLSLTSEIVI